MKFLLLIIIVFAHPSSRLMDANTNISDGVHPKYDKALEQAKNDNKPVLILFTGYSSKNNNATQELIKQSSEVRKLLDDKYIFLELYVDDRSSLYSEEMYDSETLGARVTTEGMRNADLEMSKFNNNSQPYFVILDKNEEVIATSGFLETEKEFVAFLKGGLK